MTMRKEAAAAYTGGDYLHAVELYDQILAGDPADRDAARKRDDARMATLRQLYFRAVDARVHDRQDQAGTDLEELLAHRDQWHTTFDPRMDLQAELAAQGAYLTAAVTARATQIGPLAAESLQHQHEGLLARPEFAAARASVTATIAREGEARCAALPSDTPYLAWITAAYCTHFGQPREVAAAPNLRAGLEIIGGVRGESEAQNDQLKQALAGAFAASAWYSPHATGLARSSLTGTFSTSFSSKPVQLTQSYTVSVPYTDTEEQYEPYEESYTDWETQTEQVPSTSFNADGTSETTYSTVTSSVPVTKTRTSYHWVTESVTKYRDESRDFTYDATERDGVYKAELAIAVDGLPTVVKAADRHDGSEHGYDSDAVSGEAGVAPSRANLTSTDEFAAHELRVLRANLQQQLDTAYRTLYCERTRYTPEEAAACAYLDPADAPGSAHTALATVFGTDEPFLASVLAR